MNVPAHRTTAHLDDGRLWSDTDAAVYFGVDPAQLAHLVAAGAPHLLVDGIGRRWEPEALRTWSHRRAQAGSTRTSGAVVAPRRRNSIGSGAVHKEQP